MFFVLLVDMCSFVYVCLDIAEVVALFQQKKYLLRVAQKWWVDGYFSV